MNEIISIMANVWECRTMTVVEEFVLAPPPKTTVEAFFCEKADVATT